MCHGFQGDRCWQARAPHGGAAASRGQEQQAEVEVGKPRSTEIKLPKIVLVIFEILFHI